MLVDGYETMTRKEAFAFSQRATAMHRAIETGGKPWVAVLNGLALGGGFELALAAQRRILVDDPKAVVGLPEVNVGLLPGSGGTQRLARMVGAKVALDLLLSGRQVAPAEALKLRIVDEVAPAAELLDRARAWLATAPDPVKPWDRKGYAAPEARGLLVPEVAGMFSALSGNMTKRGRYHPAPAAIPVRGVRGCAVAVRQGAHRRIEVFREAADRSGGAQHHPHHLHLEGRRGEGRASPARRAAAHRTQTRRARRRHDGRRHRPGGGDRGHRGGADRPRPANGRKRTRLHREIPRQGGRESQADPGQRRCHAGADHARRRFRAPSRLRPGGGSGVRRHSHKSRDHPQGRSPSCRRPRSSLPTPRPCRSASWRPPRRARTVSSACISSRP